MVNDLQGLALAQYGSLDLAADHAPNYGKALAAIAKAEAGRSNFSSEKLGCHAARKPATDSGAEMTKL